MIYVFGDYELDTFLYELRRDGVARQLQPRVFDILAYFLLHRDRVVLRQELLEHVWPDSFISEATFDHCIMVARKAVGDNGRAQRVIKTIRGRGYRFIAKVDVHAPSSLAAELSFETSPAHGVVPTAVTPRLQLPDNQDTHEHHHHSGEGQFCPTCGMPLQLICPQCQHQNALGSRFCNACGHALAAAVPRVAANPDMSPLVYTPRHLANEILTIRSALEGERKQVTVLFCDLVSSTPLAERLGPEGMHTLLNRFFEFALSAVHRYGGTINQFLGDGFMALFGAPLALEDHARRAALAALELHANLQERPIEVEETPLHVQIRIGLNTGLVVVGSIGDNLRMDYTAVGDTTNLAARLQQMAEPGTILMSDTSTALLHDDVQLVSLEPIYVKGKNEPITVCQVVGRAPSRSPMERRKPRILSRFVGRARELHMLHELLGQVKTGQGHVVGIVAEPGMGKSRLLREFHRSLTTQEVYSLQGGCVSYGSAMPYLPVLDLLRSACDIGDDDSLDVITGKVRRYLETTGIDRDEAEAYLFQLLGLQVGMEKCVALSPETIRMRAFAVLHQILLRRSQQRPLIIVVEDLHWIDASSEEFFVSLVDLLAHSPVLLLATYRPGYRPRWDDKSYMTQIALSRLTPSDSLTVVQSILGKKTFPHSVAQVILEKTDGNPLFLEELTQAIMKHGDLRSVTTVPDTLQGVLTARIDQLPDGTKRLLQAAAVLGRQVSARLLRAIWQEPDDLETGLQALRRLEFLHVEHGVEEPIYTFKHALTQEAAYDSMLMSRRRQLHATVGQALESLYADRLEQVYDRLAYHYSKAEQAEKAVTYLSAFAGKAVQDHAHVEAVMALQDAIAHAERLPVQHDWNRLRFELHLQCASSLHALGREQEALDRLLNQQSGLDVLQDARLNGQYALLHSQVATTLGDWEQAAKQAHVAVAAASDSGDDITTGQAYHVLAMERYWMGYPVQGTEDSQRAIALLEGANRLDRLGMANFVLGLNALTLGDFASALAAADRVHRLGEAIDDAHLQTFSCWLSGWIDATRGEWDAGVAACKQALSISSDPLNTAFALGWLGYAHIEKGEPGVAILLLEQAVLRMRQTGYRRLEGTYTAFLGAAHLLEGRTAQAREHVMRGLAIVRETVYRAGIGWSQRILGQIDEAEGALAEAETCFRDALETFTSMSARFEMGRTHLALARLVDMQADRERAILHLTEAYHLFRILGVEVYMAITEQLAIKFGVAFTSPSPDFLSNHC